MSVVPPKSNGLTGDIVTFIVIFTVKFVLASILGVSVVRCLVQVQVMYKRDQSAQSSRHL